MRAWIQLRVALQTEPSHRREAQSGHGSPATVQTAAAFINRLGCTSLHGGKWTPSIKRPVQTQLRGPRHKSRVRTRSERELQTAGKVSAKANISAPNTCSVGAVGSSNGLLYGIHLHNRLDVAATNYRSTGGGGKSSFDWKCKGLGGNCLFIYLKY